MRISDWSSDVCSSDLTDPRAGNGTTRTALLSSRHPPRSIDMRRHLLLVPFLVLGARSALAQDTPNSDDVLAAIAADAGAPAQAVAAAAVPPIPPPVDRKSTRLNSSH